LGGGIVGEILFKITFNKTKTNKKSIKRFFCRFLGGNCLSRDNLTQDTLCVIGNITPLAHEIKK
jgi:hypothetical protein